MTINEILKARGMDDASIAGVLDDLKANKLFFTSEENMDIRYPKLKGEHESQGKQLQEALATIETLQKATKGQEEAQKIINEHKAQNQALLAELEKTKVQAEAKVELLAAGALDVDYLMFKLSEKGELALDENGKLKDWDDKLAGLKTQLPAQFKTDTKRQIVENKLPDEKNGGDTVTRESILKMPYAERMKVFNENPEAYKTAMGK